MKKKLMQFAALASCSRAGRSLRFPCPPRRPASPMSFQHPYRADLRYRRRPPAPTCSTAPAADTGWATMTTASTSSSWAIPRRRASQWSRPRTCGYGPLSSGLNGYTDAQTSSIAVGCYHIQLPGTYTTFEQASRCGGCCVPADSPPGPNGTYTVRMGAYLTSEEANTALTALGVSGATVTGTSSYGVSVVKTGTSTILFQFDGGASLSLGVLPGLDNSVKTLTWYAKQKLLRRVSATSASTAGNLTVVNVVDREDYINCVISQEMSPSWPLEAPEGPGGHRPELCSLLHGTPHLPAALTCAPPPTARPIPAQALSNDNTYRAAQETSGQYVWYKRIHCGDLLFLLGRRRYGERQERLGRPTCPTWLVSRIPWEATVGQQNFRLQLELYLYRR